MKSPILKKLAGGDRRSIGNANRVTEQILKNRALLKHIVHGLSDNDPVIRMRCADVTEKVSAARPMWIGAFKPAILAFAETAVDKELRWHVAQILPRLELLASERSFAIGLLFRYLEDASQIVKTFSMQALFDLSVSHPPLRKRVIAILEEAVYAGHGATRARARRLLKTLPDYRS